MNNETVITSDDTITDKIYHIRNKKVMLDKDLAALYDSYRAVKPRSKQES
ncbi:ORF6N domain-containing protein [Mucilaginibacter pedocola]|nr:ORF6N domain-containing protein [Mucilaginibacter pedocola]